MSASLLYDQSYNEEEEDHTRQEEQEDEPQEEAIAEEDEAVLDDEVDNDDDSPPHGDDCENDNEADGHHDEAASSSSSRTPLKRPPTAYFLFLSEARPIILAELASNQAESDASGGGVSKQPSVAVVGKAIGDRWKSLTDQQRQSYHSRAAKMKEEYDAAIAKDPSLKPQSKKRNKDDADQPGNTIGGMRPEAMLPLGSIRRLIDLDSDKRKMSKEALVIMEKATEQFLGYLGNRSRLESLSHKRRGLRLSDVESVIRSTGKLEFCRMPMKRMLQTLGEIESEQVSKRKEIFQNIQLKKKQKLDELHAAQEEEAAFHESKQPEEEDQEQENRNNSSETDEADAHLDAASSSFSSSPSSSKKSSSPPSTFGACVVKKRSGLHSNLQVQAKPSKTIDAMFRRV